MAQKGYPRRKRDGTDGAHSPGSIESLERTSLSPQSQPEVLSDDDGHGDKSAVPAARRGRTHAAKVADKIERVLTASSETLQATIGAGTNRFEVPDTIGRASRVPSEARQATVGAGTNEFEVPVTSDRGLGMSSEARQAIVGAGTNGSEVPGSIERDSSVSSEGCQAAEGKGTNEFEAPGTIERDLSVSSEARQATVGAGTNGSKVPGSIERDSSVTSEGCQAAEGEGTNEFEAPVTIGRDLSVSSEARQANVIEREGTNGFEKGEGASSDEVGKANAQIAGQTSLRKLSLYDRANQEDIPVAPRSISVEYVVPSMEELPPALTIGIKSHSLGGRTLGGESVVSNDLDSTSETFLSNNSQEVSGSKALSRAVSRAVIVAKESPADPHRIEAPTPLGCFRRPSLFQRANIGEFGKEDGSRGVDDMKGDKGVDDALGVEEAKEQNSLTLGRGADNTVLRDWLMHVLEKDDQNDSKDVQDIWAAARRRRRLAYKTFETADYELYDSKVWHMHKRDTMGKAKRGANELRRHRKHMARLLTVGLGVVVGLSGSFVTFFTVTIMEAKLHFVAEVLEHHEGESGLQRYGSAFGWFWLFNIILASGAFGLCVINPWAAGSGIPETKCVLNGVSIPQVLAPGTLMCKIIGVILGVASGLPIGKEGPMIHAGAAIGGSIASLPRVKGLADFCNDRDRRDFAAIGTAAGVAAAFRTPIGGVLFTIEEGASFWSTLLTWRSFAAAVVTVVVYYLVFHGRNMLNHPLAAEDIFVFGEFSEEDSNFYMWELFVFVAIATLGGLIGALFVTCNKRLDLFRARYLSGRRRRFFECRPIPTDVEDWSLAGIDSLHHLVTLNCHDGYYNEMGTLFLNEQDRAIKLLFHFGEPGLKPATVLVFSAVFIIMECMTIGTWVCSGLFIPTLLAGAAMGRGFGNLLGQNARAYALIGATGVLGGITRMTLSLTVMLVEASGWVLFVIPLMLVLITARTVGNHFNEGIYDNKIRIRKMPFLEQEPPEETRAQNMRAHQLMSKEVVCLRPIETVSAMMSALRDYDHNCFPVVEDCDQRVLLGTVHRKNLLVLLKHRHFTAASKQDPTRPDQSLPELSWHTLESLYPNYPKVNELKIREADMDCLMDIAPYVQIGPHVINEHASAQRAYIMFRTLGLRHLVVVNHYNEVLGMVTRENLLPEHFEKGGAYRLIREGSGHGQDAGEKNRQKHGSI